MRPIPYKNISIVDRLLSELRCRHAKYVLLKSRFNVFYMWWKMEDIELRKAAINLQQTYHQDFGIWKWVGAVETLSDEWWNCEAAWAVSTTTCESWFKWNICKCCCYPENLRGNTFIKCYCWKVIFMLEADQELLVVSRLVKIDLKHWLCCQLRVKSHAPCLSMLWFSRLHKSKHGKSQHR